LPKISLVIDAIPLLLIVSVALCGGSLIAALRAKIRSQSVLLWIVGSLVLALGLLLLVLRETVGSLAGILLGNSVLLAGHVLWSCGASRHVGRTIAPDLALGAVLIGLFCIAYGLGADLNARVTIVASGIVIVSARMITAFRVAPPGVGRTLALTVLGIEVVMETVRVMAAQPALPIDGELMNGLNLQLGIAGTVGASIVAIALNWPVLRALIVGGTHAPASIPTPASAEPSAPPVEIEPDGEQGVWQLAQDRSLLIAPTGQQVRLTGNEYLVLKHLAQGAQPSDRTALNALIGRNSDNPKDRGIDVLLSRLRRKCTEAGTELPISAVRGRGYVFRGQLGQL